MIRKYFGTALIFIGIALMVTKHGFGAEQIGYWTLIFFIAGFTVNWIEQRRLRSDNG